MADRKRQRLSQEIAPGPDSAFSIVSACLQQYVVELNSFAGSTIISSVHKADRKLTELRLELAAEKERSTVLEAQLDALKRTYDTARLPRDPPPE